LERKLQNQALSIHISTMRIRIAKKDYIKLIAYHEAAHAIVGLWSGYRIKEAVINPYNPGECYVTINRDKNLEITVDSSGTARRYWQAALSLAEKDSMFFLAGPLAEAKLLGTPFRLYGGRTDIEKVLTILERLENTHLIIKSAVDIPDLGNRYHLANRLRTRTRRLIARPKIWCAIKVLANDLIGWGRLDGEDVANTAQWALGTENQPGLF